MGGLYDILESYRDQQNRLNYEGLYEEPADTSINLDPMYNIGARQFGDMRMGMPQVQATGIMQQAPTQNFEFLSSAYEDENEDGQQVDYLPGQPKSFRDSATLQEYFQNRNPLKGVGGLLGLITGNPIFGLISGGARGLGALNNKMQNSMFGQSKNLAEYFNNRKIAKATGSKDFMNRPRSERNYTGPSGGNNTGGDIGAKGAADSFSNKSGMGRTGY
jgi:hypothetical protein